MNACLCSLDTECILRFVAKKLPYLSFFKQNDVTSEFSVTYECHENWSFDYFLCPNGIFLPKFFLKPGVFSTLCAVPQKEGYLGLYKGNGAMMIRIFPYGAIQFMAFEHYKTVLGLDLFLNVALNCDFALTSDYRGKYTK